MQTDPPQDQLNALANLYHSGQMTQVVSSCKELLQTHKRSLILYNILGSALQAIGRFEEAVKSYNQAIQIYPDYVDAHYNLGNVLKELGLLDEAVKSYNKAIQLKPDYVDAHYNLSVALKDLKQLEKSIQSCVKAIQLKPDYAEAYNNLGATLQELGRLDEAVKSYNKAIQLKPDYAEAYNNLGVSLKTLGQLDEAVKSYNKAIQLKPDYAEAYSNLGNTLQDQGQLDNAIKNYNKAIELKPDYIDAHSNLLMTLNYTTDLDPTNAITMARKFGKFVTENAQMRFSNYQGLSAPKKLRVGFVSGDLCSHPVGHFLESVLSHINPDRIELIAYSNSNIIDDLSKRIKPFFSKWKSIYNQSDEAVANIIHSDRIHILVDLSGHTAYNRLPVFGWNPAPIQVSWLGYFATTGLNEMDYLLGDPYVTPPEYDSHFTEKVWRLPKTRWCFTPPNININAAELPALNNGYITFGCFNNLTKMNDEVVELWSKVLNSIPNSRLLLKAKQFRDKSTQESVIQRFNIQGVKSERITLEEPEKREKYFAAYNQIDIALDPFPFTGGTTSVECLWMGVPVLTLAGDSLISRQGVGILMNIGLPNWIAENESEYITKSIFFASDLEKLATLRSRLRRQILTSPLFDAQSFAQDFEKSLWEMWGQYLQKS